MVAIARALTIPRFNRTGIMALALVLLLTISLFFIPEIMSVSKTAPEKLPVVAESVGSTTSTELKESREVLVERSAPSEDGLAEISRLLDEGYIDRLRDEKINAARGIAPTRAADSKDANANASLIERVGIKPVKVGDDRIMPKGPLVEGQISWRGLQSAPAKQALKVTSHEALAIMRGLDPKMAGSRTALLSYSSALDQLLENGERSIAAEDVPGYLATLEATVVDRLRAERADRADFIRFSEIALANRFSGQTTSGVEVPKFNPRFTLDSVAVIQTSDRFGRFIPTRKAEVRVAGFVIGRDVIAIRAVRYGQEIRWVRPDDKPDRVGRRRFHFDPMDARGVYVFEIESSTGEIFKKTYDFYSRARTFPWRADMGFQFIAPIPQGDSRLDRLYARSVAARSGYGNLFSPSQSSEIGRF